MLTPVPATSEGAVKIISRRRFLLIGCSAVGIALLAGVNKNQQAQGDPVATPTGVLSDDTAAALVDTPAVTAESAATPTAVPAAAATSQRVATRCPHGLVNDPYPGRCRHYIDKNGNGLCDLSETA